MSEGIPEQYRQWQRERLEHRLSVIRKERPSRLRHKGEPHPDVKAWGQRLLDGETGNLLLCGPVGALKTWNVWEILERAVTAGYDGRILFARSAMWRDAITIPVDKDMLRRMREADVLVLDDLGSGGVTEWELQLLLSIVDERWAHERSVVVTSNVKSLKTTLGERIASRLADGATVVVLDGEDRRRAS